jgi:hypothetical protein
MVSINIKKTTNEPLIFLTVLKVKMNCKMPKNGVRKDQEYITIAGEKFHISEKKRPNINIRNVFFVRVQF